MSMFPSILGSTRSGYFMHSLSCGRFGLQASLTARYLLSDVVVRSFHNQHGRGKKNMNRRKDGRSNSRFRNHPAVGRRGFEGEKVPFGSSNFTKVVRIDADSSAPEVTIDSLKETGLMDEQLWKAIRGLKFASLTPVQQRTVEPILKTEGDVIARAKTGTGKTLAFLVPMFQELIRTKDEDSNMIKSVIIAPTRDLAIQIQDEIRKLYKSNPALRRFGCATMVGGTSMNKSLFTLHRERPNIAVATPGRLLDMLQTEGKEFFSALKFKVFDEADTLLQIGFKRDLQEISNILNGFNKNGPSHIRTLMFSATIGEDVETLANSIMNSEKCLFIDTVDKNEPEAHERIEQTLVVSKDYADNLVAPISAISRELDTDVPFKAILFLPTVKAVDMYANLLKKMFRRLPVTGFHGKLSQMQRTKLVQRFKEASHGLFVCTDVGARGMDFPAVSHVYQLGVPTSLSNYIHRIGRTARAGTDGKAVLFLCEAELPFLSALRHDKKISFPSQDDFVPEQAISEKCSTLLSSNSYDFEETLKSLLSFYVSVSSIYRLKTDIISSVAHSFGKVKGYPDAKIRVGIDNLNKYSNSKSFSFNQDIFELVDKETFRPPRAPVNDYRARNGGRPSRERTHEYSDDFRFDARKPTSVRRFDSYERKPRRREAASNPFINST